MVNRMVISTEALALYEAAPVKRHGTRPLVP
jgi:hypothetical protein